MLPDEEKVKKYFEIKAHSFDAVYTFKSSVAMRFVNKFMRWEIRKRIEISLAKLKGRDIRSILDVGCGSGRLSVELVKYGKDVLGIDFSNVMINLAQDLKTEKMAKNCDFIYADFLGYNFEKTFDAVVALGFFDYISRPAEYIKKISGITGKIFISSFPMDWTCRSFFRRIRLTFQRCPVYFYTPSKIKKLLKANGFKIVDLRVVGKSYLIEAYKING